MALSHKFHTLDGMRGVACVAVMLLHLAHEAGSSFFAFGFLAVDLFFVLSGFVIAHSYDHRLASTMSIGTFMLRRFIRLWPMIFVGCAIGLVAAVLAWDDNGEHELAEYGSAFMLNSVFLPSPFVGARRMFPLNPPEWSLFYEMLANMGLALLFVFGFRLRSQRVVLLFAICGCAAFLILTVLTRGTIGLGFTWGAIPIGIARVGFSFAVGVLIRRTMPAWIGLLPKVHSVLLLIVLGALFALDPAFVPRSAYEVLFVLLLSPLLVMAGAGNEASARYEPACAWLGKISFPLYAVHVPIFWIGSGVARQVDLPPFVLLAPLAVSLPFLAAWLADTYDAPARAALTRLIPGGRREAAG